MSALSGISLKGERGKPKYQLRDINSLYRGESLEPHQQKSTLPRKHGMQSLGKIPSARRPPANLPSLKSEHSGNDPAVSLVPSGGTGWGSKPGETGQAPTTPPTTSTVSVPTSVSQQNPAVTTPSTSVTSAPSTAPPAVTTSPAPRPVVSSQPTVHADKSWSSIMAGNAEGNVHPPSFLAHQSPQFQQEFPKLSGDGQPAASGKGTTDTQYGPGPSLRPQTEGSWIQGGGRKSGPQSGQMPSGGVVSGALQGAAALGPLGHVQGQGSEENVGSSRGSLGPCAALGGVLAPGGPATNTGAGTGVAPPHLGGFRPLIPSFLFRGNFTAGFRPNLQRPPFMMPTDSRFMPPATRPTASVDDEVIPRPIIKEEDFSKMDDIARDAGWATHDDIDYNQKLAFSDDESTLDDDGKDGKSAGKDDKRSAEKDMECDGQLEQSTDKDSESVDHKIPGPGPRGVEDEEIWREKRRQHCADVAMAVARARQRKEEEEQRYQKTKQGAALKLQQLEQKIGKKTAMENKENFEDSQSRASRADWEKEHEADKERDRDRSRTSSEGRDEKAPADLRPLQQIGGDRTFRCERDAPRTERERERELRAERERDWESRPDRYKESRSYRDRHDQPTFSNDFQHNLPPRFQKQQAERFNFSRSGSVGPSNSVLSGKPQGSSSASQSSSVPQGVNNAQSFDSRWNGPSSHVTSFHFSGQLSGNGNMKPSHASHRCLHGDSETMSSDRDREREHDRDVDEMSSSWDHRDTQMRRDRHTPEVDRGDRFRSRDYRPYSENGSRKPSSNYYDASSDYTRGYRRSSQDYDKSQDYDRSREQEEPVQDVRDSVQSRDIWEKDRDAHHNDEHRDSDMKSDTYERHHSGTGSLFGDRDSSSHVSKDTDEWHEDKEWKKSQEGDNKDWCDRERDERPQRPGSCESRSSKDSTREEKTLHNNDKQIREFSWVDAASDLHGLDSKTEKRLELHREERRDIARHPPGPITREKLEAAELRSEQKRSSLTQLKRSVSGPGLVISAEVKPDLKEGQVKLSEFDQSSEPKVSEQGESWRKPASNTENLTVETTEVLQIADKVPETNKVWSETTSVVDPAANCLQMLVKTVPPECAVDNKESDIIPTKEVVEDVSNLKEKKPGEVDTLEKDLKKVPDVTCEAKTDKETRNRGHSRSDQSRGRHSSYAVYRGSGWSQQRDARTGRWGGTNRTVQNLRNCDDWTESEDVSGDEVSASTESGKEDVGRAVGAPPRRADKDARRAPRSPKQNTKKIEKDERNRDTRRNEGDKNVQTSDSRRFEKRTYESPRGGREGFAPRGEPSRRGRGGFRFRGSLGKRMDGYGPPSSKSPFGQPSDETKIIIPDSSKESQKNMEPLVNEINKDDIGGEIISNEDKIKQKQQVLSAGIIGSGVRHHANSNKMSSHVPPRMQRKSESERRDSSRSKGGNSSRGGGHGQGRTSQRTTQSTHTPEIGDECWETTSENSEVEDRESNGKRNFPRPRDSHSGSRRSRSNKGISGSGGGSSRVAVSEKHSGQPGYGITNAGVGAGQRGTLSQNSRAHNHRGNTNNTLAVSNKPNMKELSSSVNKVDENKINGPALISQSGSDSNSSKRKVEKDKTNALDNIDFHNYASVVIVDDQPEVTLEEGHFPFDADSGFQEVRSKKNVKESRQKGSAEEPKTSGRPPREKEPRKPKGGNSLPQSMPQQGLPVSVQQQMQQSNAVSQQRQSPVPAQQQSQAAVKTNQQQQSTQQQQQPPQRQQQQNLNQVACGGLNSVSASQPGSAVGSTITGAQVAAPTAKFPPDRQRQNKLPPRFAKQRMKIAEQQGLGPSDAGKVNHNRLFSIKDMNNAAPAPTVNAWTKPINASLRPNSPASNPVPNLQQLAVVLGNPMDQCPLEVSDQPASGASSHRSTPNSESVQAKTVRESADKTVLDGTSPPVQTIIFENTNFKTSPADLAVKNKFSSLKSSRGDKSRDRKMIDDVEESPLIFSSKASGAITELVKNTENKADPIQMQLGFNKNEDVVDMKLDFTFDPELSQLAEEKGAKTISMPRSMHLSQQVQSTISPSTAELNLKIQSVKRVWENVPAMPPVIEHTEDGSVASTASSFTPSFANPVDSALDPSSFVKSVDGCSVVAGDESSSLSAGEVVYSAGTALQGNSNSCSPGVQVSAVTNMKTDSPSTNSNVCKVKPQQQPVISAGPSPIGHSGPLSPPPFNSSTAQQGHINFQPTLGGTAAQYGGISAIPSPPTVLYNSPGQGGLYAPFQIEGPQVMGGQARSQFSGFPPYGLSQGIGQTSAFSQQSVYLQTPAHPPPSAAPDIYQSSMSPFRLTAPQGPFGQSQQLSSNPNTVLISSTSNSLMSATVKPSSQQIGPIGAIGTKAGGPYQQNTMPSAPQPSQLFIQYDPNQVIGQNYLPNSQMVQRPGPVQSNVVPPIPPSSSFYSGSAGGQTGFYQPTNSNLPQPASAQQMHQTGSPYSIQGYNTQSGTATPVGLQGFGSQFLSSQLQIAQQYRNAGVAGQAFLKSGAQHQSDHSSGSNGRAQPKSPSGSQTDVLSSVSVFSSVPQIASPKSRNAKQQQQQQAPPVQQHQHAQQHQQAPQQPQPQQQSPTQQQVSHHKFGTYQGVSQTPGQLPFQQGTRGQVNVGVRGGMPPSATPIYPPPIQRPVAYSQGAGVSGNNMMGGRQRPQPSQQPQQMQHAHQQPQQQQHPHHHHQHPQQQQQQQQIQHEQQQRQQQQPPQPLQQQQQSQQQSQQSQQGIQQQHTQTAASSRSQTSGKQSSSAPGQQPYYTTHGMKIENNDGKASSDPDVKISENSNPANGNGGKLVAVNSSSDQKLSSDNGKEENPPTLCE